MLYFRLAYIQQTLDVLKKSDQLLNQLQEAAEAQYRVGQGNQQDVLKAQLQHTKILQEAAHHHQEEGLLEAQLKQLLGRPQEPRDIVSETLTLRDFRSRLWDSCSAPVSRIQMSVPEKLLGASRKRRSNWRTRIFVPISTCSMRTGSGFLRDDEGASVATRHVAASSGE
jgi:hypothetical protein